MTVTSKTGNLEITTRRSGTMNAPYLKLLTNKWVLAIGIAIRFHKRPNKKRLDAFLLK